MKELEKLDEETKSLLIEETWNALRRVFYKLNNYSCNCWLEPIKPANELVWAAIKEAYAGDGWIRMEVECVTSDDPNGPANYVCTYRPRVYLASLYYVPGFAECVGC